MTLDGQVAMDQQHVTEQKRATHSSTASAPTSLAPPSGTLMNTSLPTPPQTPCTENNVLSKAKRVVANSARDPDGQSQSSLDSPSSRSKQEYMDSLVPPSSDEMSRISQVQLQRQQEDKRKHREKEKELRKSADVSRSSLDVESVPKHGSSIFSRHKKTESLGKGHSRHSSIAAAAVASATANGSEPNPDDLLRHRAATLIQRTYRGYRTRREMKGLGLNADTRWTHAIREMKFREMTTPRSRLSNDEIASQDNHKSPGSDGTAARKSSSARYKWRKVATIAGRAAQDMDYETSDSGSDSDSQLSTSEKREQAHRKREEAKARRRKDARMMGLQYFLEMVDLKHRYGSNLRTYHEEWKKSDTKENFFYWLDYGEGRNLDMTTCPRERLDREQVRYLSREERQYYVVQVDQDGRLCWAKNGARIDTTEKWKDSIHGIVPADDPTPAFRPKSDNPNQPRLFQDDTPRSPTSDSTGSSSSRTSEAELEAARAAKYASPGFTDAKGYKKVTHLSASTIFNTLLRKSVRKNTWIFVADTSFRLYVGIKDSGAFQHSSFLQGSRISAAGLVKIKNGRLTSLSPLSGHYRPPASNFRAFVRSLKEEGVDMSHVSISKSYAVLVGLEMYMKSQQKGKDLVKKITQKKDKVLHPEEVEKRIEEERDKSQSAEKERRFLEKQAEEEEKRREENRAAVRVMQKLGITPAVPEGQKDAEEVVEGGDAQMEMETVQEKPVQEEKEDAAATSEAAAQAAGSSAAPAADEKEAKSTT